MLSAGHSAYVQFWWKRFIWGERKFGIFQLSTKNCNFLSLHQIDWLYIKAEGLTPYNWRADRLESPQVHNAMFVQCSSSEWSEARVCTVGVPTMRAGTFSLQTLCQLDTSGGDTLSLGHFVLQHFVRYNSSSDVISFNTLKTDFLLFFWKTMYR